MTSEIVELLPIHGCLVNEHPLPDDFSREPILENDNTHYSSARELRFRQEENKRLRKERIQKAKKAKKRINKK